MDRWEKAPHSEITKQVLGCAFEVMQELGSGFLESVYKNSLFIALQQKGLKISSEQSFEVYFRDRRVGLFVADLTVEESVIIELKCCKNLAPEHQAQVINYLKATDILVGLLINFGNRKLEYKRLLHPSLYPAAEGDPAHPVLFDH